MNPLLDHLRFQIGCGAVHPAFHRLVRHHSEDQMHSPLQVETELDLFLGAYPALGHLLASKKGRCCKQDSHHENRQYQQPLQFESIH
jgi:hypothetical protein